MSPDNPGVILEIRITKGDIMDIKSDALMTLINPKGRWSTDIDNHIIQRAGDQFHKQALNMLRSGSSVGAVVANRQITHRGRFTNIVFVADKPKANLSDLVRYGLDVAAKSRGIKHVTLPPLRLEDATQPIEDRRRIAKELMDGIVQHGMETTLEVVTIVVDDATTEGLLRFMLPTPHASES